MNNKNPYLWGNSESGLLDSFCLYIDFLGIASIINEIKSFEEKNEKFRQFYRIIRESMDYLNMKSHSNKNGASYIWKTKAFSDNIVLGCPIQLWRLGNNEGRFGSIISMIAHLQMDLFLKGYFLRGGLSTGLLFIDHIIVYGDALVEAYKTEQEVRWPAIYLSESTKKLVTEEYLLYYRMPEDAPQYHDLIKDEAGGIFVNYLISLVDPEGAIFKEDLMKHKSIIETSINKYKNRPDVLVKYKWLADYHNYFCSSFIYKCPEKYFISHKYNNRFFRIA